MAADGVVVLDHRVKDAGAQQLYMAEHRLMHDLGHHLTSARKSQKCGASRNDLAPRGS